MRNSEFRSSLFATALWGLVWELVELTIPHVADWKAFSVLIDMAENRKTIVVCFTDLSIRRRNISWEEWKEYHACFPYFEEWVHHHFCRSSEDEHFAIPHKIS